jgi:hypothetical protein
MTTPSASHLQSAITRFSIRQRIISYPRFKEALELITRLHLRALNTDHPGGLLITGLSGAGKSTIKSEYEGRYPRQDLGEVTVIPVLTVDTPAGPTVKNLAESILVALGDPMSHQGSAEHKTHRIYYFLKLCKVELLLIDEFQHFVEHAKRNEALRVTDWLKNLINQARIPVVLFGLPNSEEILRLNVQLARRFSARYYLRPFSIDDEQEVREYRGVLKVIENALPLPSVSLSTQVMAKRFYFATYGLIDYIGKIVDGAVLLALLEKSPTITEKHYAEAFKEEVWRDVPEKLNPFSSKARLRLLVKASEPFERMADRLVAKADHEALKEQAGL